MEGADWGKLLLYGGTLAVLAPPLGAWIAKVLAGERTFVHRFGEPIERLVYRLSGIDPNEEMRAKTYGLSLLAFNLLGIASLFLIQLLQRRLPLDPAGLPGVPWHTALNAAVSFVTNTNWQSYAGETTMSVLTQMSGLAVWNFLSAATGFAVLAALARAFSRAECRTLGSFWRDLVRATLYVLLPLSMLLGVLLMSQGVVQTFRASRNVDGHPVAVGPVASQVAIKQLGTNGGGYYGANSSHPIENPTPVSNYLELVSILLLPAAQVLAFGRMVGDRRQGRALLATMILLFVPAAAIVVAAEHRTPPAWIAAGAADDGAWEGKEVRFGITESALWAAATTAASNGSVNCMHDSLTPLGGLVPLTLILMGEVVFGGVGAGLYGMVVFAVLAVFVAGLMVGRTPEYLRKKIEAREMRWAVVATLAPAFAVLAGAALACVLPWAARAAQDPGPHGFSEILYAYASAGNNNGSAFGGFEAFLPWHDVALAIAMVIGRYGVILPVLALASSVAAKKTVAPSAGTLPTHGPLFVVFLAGVVLLLGALTFAPALALGPVADELTVFPWS